MTRTMLRDAICRALFAGATFAVVLPLHAQDAPAAADAEGTPAPATLQTVTVTGSRIARAVDVETVQPVQVISRVEMQRMGLQSVADILQSSTAIGSPAISRADALSSGENVGGSYISMRDLGPQRTLILLDGQRLGTTTSGYSDVSQIPTAVVERIEILKDGASSIYGSDAIAGVVNIITRRRFDGGEANVYLGEYDVGDGRKQSYDATFGLTNDRGWITAGVAHAVEDPVWAKDRAFTADGTNSAVSEKGVLRIGRTNPSTWLTYASGDPRDLASYRPYTSADYAEPNAQMSLMTGMERTSVFANAGVDLNEHLTLVVDALYNHRDTMQQIAGYPWQSSGSNLLSGQSWFNPTGNDVHYFRRTWEVPRVTDSKATTQRYGVKLEGRFDAGGMPWTYDTGFFQNTFRTVKDSTGNLLIPAVQRATGASWFNPATNRVECGTAAAPIMYGANYGAGQCIPWNPLAPYGSGVVGSLADPALQSYLMPIGHDVGETETTSLFANVAGVLAELPAGDLGLAVGYEHRRERGNFSPDALRQTGLSTNLGSGNSGGAYHLDELYAEANIPLLADKPYAQVLAVNLSSRYSNYSSFGATTNSKVGMEWKPIADLMVRGTWGEGFRAPTINDLYGPQNQSFVFYTDPCDSRYGAARGTPACDAAVPPGYQQIAQGGIPAAGPNSQSNMPFLSGSNPDLQPEESETATIGFVYSPSEVEGLNVSLDWWRVSIDNAIVADSATAILNDCYVRNVSSSCARFTRDAVTGEVTSLSYAVDNIAAFETAGYDFGVRYRFPEQSWGVVGLAWDTTYVDYYQAKVSSDAQVATQYTGWAGNFRVRSNLNTDWSLGNHGVRWGLRYYSALYEDCTSNGCSDPDFAAPYTNGKVVGRNRVGSNTFNDMQYRWSTPWESTVSVGANNVFDKVGPTMYSQPNSSFNYYGGFDIGRFLYLQYQQKF
ncbi:TonB-dependent receptor [Lysobacter dokdonensis DS-58]|uniref:TonB-dependent receptor n=1 Tax=Lysobacter dokdonensis DS-58 TaxID=1300345 RepID=A0A0A2WH84_9GAMM|nr:TonB-dependent receptor [Lysobacter dokdonensis]KGQ19556.1 TonB-dependent receptor [Lysobacter dokdonensis DS-58]